MMNPSISPSSGACVIRLIAPHRCVASVQRTLWAFQNFDTLQVVDCCLRFAAAPTYTPST